MKSSVLCLLFATAAFAVDYNHLQHPSNLIYSFSQQRLDQPPHVEMRDEDLGKYRNRPRTSTTEMPALAFNAHPSHAMENMPMQQHHNLATTPRTYVDEHKNQIANRHLPATMPPAPATPKWMDLSDNLQAYQHDHLAAPSQVSASQFTRNGDHPLPQMQNNYLSHSTHPMNSAHYHTRSTRAPESHIMHQPIHEHLQHKSRGNHKFSLEDVIEPRHQSISNMPSSTNAPVLPHSQNAARPVPTLSPWSGDNFGK